MGRVKFCRPRDSTADRRWSVHFRKLLQMPSGLSRPFGRRIENQVPLPGFLSPPRLPCRSGGETEVEPRFSAIGIQDDGVLEQIQRALNITISPSRKVSGREIAE